MAHISTNHPAFSDAVTRLFDGIRGFFSSFGKAMIINSTARARLETVERLQSKSDAELARLGLKREDIVRRVFHEIW